MRINQSSGPQTGQISCETLIWSGVNHAATGGKDRSTYRKLYAPAVVILMILSGLVLNSCSESTTDAGPGDEPGPNEVQMVGQSFTPSTMQVTEGTTVTWVNTSSETHTVTSGANRQHDGRFDSGNVPPGGEYAFTFGEAGTYPYFCVPHVGMAGSIIVVAGDDDY
jgi:plastocyanin